MASMMATELIEDRRVAVADRAFRIEHAQIAAAKEQSGAQWRQPES